MNNKLQISLILIFLIQLISGCSNESVPECFKNAGATVSYEVAVAEFSSINIAEGIELIIKEGAEREVIIETSENLKGAISADITNGELVLRNNTGCNWVRDYNITKVYVTTPALTHVYSASQFAVKSHGVLTYPELLLQSGLYGETASGSFELQVNCISLAIEDNQSIYCKISGAVENLSVSYYSGDARFEGANLIAEKVQVFHRSSNDIIVNPQQEVKGTIYSTGDLVLVNHPPVIEVGRLYSGALLFR